jgi:hypothetical protein
LSKWNPAWCNNFGNIFAGAKQFSNDSPKYWKIKKGANVDSAFFDTYHMIDAYIKNIADAWGVKPKELIESW